MRCWLSRAYHGQPVTNNLERYYAVLSAERWLCPRQGPGVACAHNGSFNHESPFVEIICRHPPPIRALALTTYMPAQVRYDDTRGYDWRIDHRVMQKQHSAGY